MKADSNDTLKAIINNNDPTQPLRKEFSTTLKLT